MVRPTPIRPRENDDLEVPFADPRIRAPVQWLGRRLAPGRGLPTLRLAYTNGPERPEPDERLPTPRARLEYELRRPRTDRGRARDLAPDPVAPDQPRARGFPALEDAVRAHTAVRHGPGTRSCTRGMRGSGGRALPGAAP